MTVFGAVFARGGSKGVPGKNLRKVAGKSLLEHSIALGIASPLIHEMICSTDSQEIAAEAKLFGADVPFLRPNELSRDTSPEWGAWQHLVAHLLSAGAEKADLLVSLPTTAPLRLAEDIHNAVNLFQSSEFDVVLGVSESARNPWFNMVTRREDSRVVLAARSSETDVSRRQDAPSVFDITTVVYVTTLGFVSNSSALFDGLVGSVLIPPERAIDIDTELDLDIADHLLRKRLESSHEQ